MQKYINIKDKTMNTEKINLVKKVFLQLAEEFVTKEDTARYSNIRYGEEGAIVKIYGEGLEVPDSTLFSKEAFFESIDEFVKDALRKNAEKVVFTQCRDNDTVSIDNVDMVEEDIIECLEKYTDEEVEGLEIFIFWD